MFQEILSIHAGRYLAHHRMALNNSMQAVAAEPETQEITFLVWISVGFYSPLSDYIGDDTIGVLFKKYETASDTLNFAGGSPPCDGHEVSGTSWERARLSRRSDSQPRRTHLGGGLPAIQRQQCAGAFHSSCSPYYGHPCLLD